MKKFAFIGARMPPRLGCIAIICGALLGLVAAAAPAQSGDLYYPYEYTGGYPGYNGYYRNCNPCCRPCCYQCGYRPYVRPGPVVERHWDYWERRYPHPYPHRYPYPNGYAGGYPYYPNGYTGGYPYYPGGYAGGPRPHLGFGGVQYPPSAPISYEYGAPPREPYEYEALGRPGYEYSARPAYDFDASPRPPAGIPGGYYNAGYVQ